MHQADMEDIYRSLRELAAGFNDLADAVDEIEERLTALEQAMDDEGEPDG